MEAIKNLIASFLVASLLTGCTTTAQPVKSAAVETPTLQERKPAEITATENKIEPVDLGNIYTFTQTSVKEYKAEIESKNSTTPKPAAAKPFVVESAAPKKIEAKPVTKAEPIKVESKPVVKPAAKLPTLPPNAIPLLSSLRETLDLLWSTIPARSYIAAKIEQETCISLKHSKCWSTRAELKTSREYGFGLGQTTVAYNKDGTERFNVWKDLIKLDPVLKAKWTWDNRFDAQLQLRATVVKSKLSYDAVRFPTYNQEEHLAFGFVTYNSGSVLIDRRLCINVKGCDPSRWYGHVELHSSKSKVAQKGYGKSFFEISREYPRNIMYVRRDKYIPYLDK